MRKRTNSIQYTDTRQHIYWDAFFGSVVLLLGMVGLFKDGMSGLVGVLLATGVFLYAAAFMHIKYSGKRVTMTLSDEGIEFEGGLFVPFDDVDRIWIADPFPMLALGFTNVVLHLKKDVKIKQSGRTWKSAFFLTHVGCNISAIRKKKMVTYMSPGIKVFNGPKMKEDDIIEEIMDRFETYLDRE
ncbi:hypothetical protein RYA05_06050 [Pseudomonas syringae pv. actinidiae]|nr:hypothetical protein [Pseudomonas syringae pv. actinidiae]